MADLKAFNRVKGISGVRKLMKYGKAYDGYEKKQCGN